MWTNCRTKPGQTLLTLWLHRFVCVQLCVFLHTQLDFLAFSSTAADGQASGSEEIWAEWEKSVVLLWWGEFNPNPSLLCPFGFALVEEFVCVCVCVYAPTSVLMKDEERKTHRCLLRVRENSLCAKMCYYEYLYFSTFVCFSGCFGTYFFLCLSPLLRSPASVWHVWPSKLSGNTLWARQRLFRSRSMTTTNQVCLWWIF